MAMAACGHSGSDHEHEHDHEGTHEHAEGHDHDHGGHDHGDVKLQLTAYAGGMEAYAECTPLAKGHKAEMLVHLTETDGFGPAEGWAVTAAIGSVQAEGDDLGGGKYDLDFTPAATGQQTLTLTAKGPGGQTAVFSWPVTVYCCEHDAMHEADEAIDSRMVPGAVAFTKEMSWRVGFGTDSVQRGAPAHTVRVTAVVETSSGSSYALTAPVSGVVTLADRTLAVGSQVRQGQALMRIDGDRTAGGSLSVAQAEAKSAVQLARSEYERKRVLGEEGIVARAEVERALSEYEKAEANYRHLSSRFGSGSATVTAPAGGWLTSLAVLPGEHVAEGAVLGTVAGGGDMVLRVQLSPRQAAMLGTADDATVALPGGERVSVRRSGGSVSMASAPQPGSTMLPVTLRLPGGAGLLPGMHLQAWLAGPQDAAGLSVPAGALVEEMGEKFVYVQITPELFERRHVTVGATDGQNVSVTSGLRGDERVVTRGAVMVSLASATAAVDPHAGHNH